MNTTIGTCGNCGGRVSAPSMWLGTMRPTPKCESCGAVPAEPHGRTIAMRPSHDPKRKRIFDDSGHAESAS